MIRRLTGTPSTRSWQCNPQGRITENGHNSKGLEVSEARRLKSLEDENRRLKKLLAEAMLDNAALKDILGKNG